MSNLSDLDHDPRFDASRVIRAPRGAQRAARAGSPKRATG